MPLRSEDLRVGTWYFIEGTGPAKLCREPRPDRPNVEVWTPWGGLSWPLLSHFIRVAAPCDVEAHAEHLAGQIRYLQVKLEEVLDFIARGDL